MLTCTHCAASLDSWQALHTHQLRWHLAAWNAYIDSDFTKLESFAELAAESMIGESA